MGERERERERDREILLGFWGLPSVHLEREKYTFSLSSASLLCGCFKHFLTRLAHILEYVIYVIPEALQNDTADVDAIVLLLSSSSSSLSTYPILFASLGFKPTQPM